MTKEAYPFLIVGSNHSEIAIRVRKPQRSSARVLRSSEQMRQYALVLEIVQFLEYILLHPVGNLVDECLLN